MGPQPFYMSFRKETFGCVATLVYQVLFGDVNTGLARREKNQKQSGLTIVAMILQNAVSLSRFHAHLARPCALCQGWRRLTSYHHLRASHSRQHSLTIHALSARPCALCQGMPRLTSYHHLRASHSPLHSLTIHAHLARPCAQCQGKPRLFSYNGYRLHNSVDVTVQQKHWA
jgi:TPP-dependent indolepyruvate ferredoxin oxidoreductase alpha subunit